MRKLFSLLLISLLLTSMGSPAFGSGYRETALAYLMKNYSVPEEKIELYESGITELEFTAESFWSASYMIASEEKSTSGFSGGVKPVPLPAPETIRLPAPERPSTSSPAILPIPPQDVIDGDYIYDDTNIYGGIYIRIKTGEILEQDQMEQFFSTEWRLAEKEWERLRKEAGKLDVALYRKLQGLPAAEKVTVWIQPIPLESDDLRAQFAALKKKYPEHTLGMELMEFLPYDIGYAVTDIRGGGVSSSGGSSGFPVSEGDVATSYVLPDSVERSQLLEKPGAEISPMMPNEEYLEEYYAFWEELEEIRVLAVIPSLASINEALKGMGITYRDNGTSLAADLTTAQIYSIAKLSAVSAVFEEVIFTTMDGGVDMLGRSSAPNEINTASMEVIDMDVRNNESSFSYLPLIPIFVGVLAVLVVYRRRIIRTS